MRSSWCVLARTCSRTWSCRWSPPVVVQMVTTGGSLSCPHRVSLPTVHSVVLTACRFPRFMQLSSPRVASHGSCSCPHRVSLPTVHAAGVAACRFPRFMQLALPWCCSPGSCRAGSRQRMSALAELACGEVTRWTRRCSLNVRSGSALHQAEAPAAPRVASHGPYQLALPWCCSHGSHRSALPRVASRGPCKPALPWCCSPGVMSIGCAACRFPRSISTGVAACRFPRFVQLALPRVASHGPCKSALPWCCSPGFMSIGSAACRFPWFIPIGVAVVLFPWWAVSWSSCLFSFPNFFTFLRSGTSCRSSCPVRC